MVPKILYSKLADANCAIQDGVHTTLRSRLSPWLLLYRLSIPLSHSVLLRCCPTTPLFPISHYLTLLSPITLSYCHNVPLPHCGILPVWPTLYCSNIPLSCCPTQSSSPTVSLYLCPFQSCFVFFSYIILSFSITALLFSPSFLQSSCCPIGHFYRPTDSPIGRRKAEHF